MSRQCINIGTIQLIGHRRSESINVVSPSQTMTSSHIGIVYRVTDRFSPTGYILKTYLLTEVSGPKISRTVYSLQNLMW